MIATKQEEQHELQDPLTAFIYGLKVPETKRQWPCRLKIFLDYLSLEHGTLEEKAKQFIVKSRQSPQRAQDNLMKFIAFQHQRGYTRRDVWNYYTSANYYKATKLFCERQQRIITCLLSPDNYAQLGMTLVA